MNHIPAINEAYLNAFKNNLQAKLLDLLPNENTTVGKRLLESEDIDRRWVELGPEYLADAVMQIKDYPTVSVAWAAFLGMAVAWQWDNMWELCAHSPYRSYYGKEGFDDMDEHIITEIIGLNLDSDESLQINNLLRRCGETTVTFIRHQNIEPQSPLAYHVFTAACKVMFKIGASVELKRLGYKYENINPE